MMSAFAPPDPVRSHTLSDQLHHIFVVGNHEHIQILLRGLQRHGADHVVRFVSLHFQNRQPHGLAQSPHKRQLHTHFIRHRLPLRFVFFKKFVAKRRSGRIEHDSDVIRLVILDEPAKNIAEEERHVGRRAVRPGQPLRHRRKEGPVDVGHSIYKKEFFRCSRHAGEYSKAMTHKLLLGRRNKRHGPPGYF